MLFSFTTLAVSLWLGLVAVACLHRLWRATADEGSGYGSRDHSRATAGEFQRRHRDFSSEGPISLARRSVISISCAVISAIQAGLSRAFQWLSKMVRSSDSPQDSMSRLSATPVEVSNSPSGSHPVPRSGGLAVSVLSDEPAGAPPKKRARRALKETPEPRLSSGEPRRRKSENHLTEKVARTTSKLGKNRSAKKSQKMDAAAADTAKKTTRTKRKISPASKPTLTPKVSV